MTTPATVTITAPLLTSRQSTSDSPSARTTTMLSLLLGLFAGRRGASMLVRQTAARQLEDWREDWGYSLRVVVLDMTWNLVFVVVSVVMLLCTMQEKPNVPLRVWICVYALQCAIHMVLVWLEYRRRVAGEQTTVVSLCFWNNESGDGSDEDLENYTMIGDALRPENINTKIAYMWWVIGFCWLMSDFKILLHSAPRLFWLVLTFLAIDIFFTFLAFFLACLLGLAVCFCFPCIIAFLCIISGRERASEADISVLPKYRFEASSDEGRSDVGAGRMVPIETNGREFSGECVLLADDAGCCICLSPYEDGAELLSLLCNHHFHATCIVKWLKMNATCPLCKYNIKRNEQSFQENHPLLLGLEPWRRDSTKLNKREHEHEHGWTCSGATVLFFRQRVKNSRFVKGSTISICCVPPYIF